MGSMDQNKTFSEHGHVAYQINGITKCSNMVANILPADPLYLPQSLTVGKGPQFKLIFLEHGHVAYQSIGTHEMQ